MHLIYIVSAMAFIHFPFEPLPISQTDYHAARQKTATEEALAARLRRFEKMSVPLFMLPSLTL